MLKQFLLLNLFLILYSFGIAQTVQTESGSVTGHMNGDIYEFLGIPYASPPIDTLRWKAPLAHEAWSTPLLAENFPPICPQKRFEQGQPDSVFTIEGNEDCLYLNIWTPDTVASLPVLVFIHGGGNQQGSSSEVNGGTQMFHGKNMSERGNVVVVTIQYRLGPLGFLVHPGLEEENVNNISGNYAILDQILALTWIKSNIEKFGGNPSKVMVFGESAGGLNVGDLLLTKLSEGLFQRACIESGTPIIADYDVTKNEGISFVENYISTGTDTEKINFMRTIPADSLVKDEESPVSGGTVGLAWSPVLDNYIFKSLPTQCFQNGTFNKVPLIIGSNSDEMSLSAPQTVYPLMVNALIKASVPESLQAQAELLYPLGTNTTEARESYVSILTDLQFTAPARRTSQCVSRNQTEPVWRYFFTHKHTVAALAPYGSYHGMELFYVFNNWENATLGSGILFKPADDSVQQNMLKYWVNFANTGNPNDGLLPVWPQYNADNDCYMNLKATPDGTYCGLRTEKCNLWDTIVNYTGCSGTTGFNNIVSYEQLTCYPNPSDGIFYFNETLEKINEISVFNLFGQKIIPDIHSNYFDISKEASGIYCIFIKTGSKIYKSTIIKVK